MIDIKGNHMSGRDYISRLRRFALSHGLHESYRIQLDYAESNRGTIRIKVSKRSSVHSTAICVSFEEVEVVTPPERSTIKEALCVMCKVPYAYEECDIR